LPTVIHGLTGLEFDKAGLQALSARVSNLSREFNLREGMTPADDTLPPRLVSEPLRTSGERLTQPELDSMIEDYYERRGWSRE
ncbi:MAG: aldehyde ferredoxin oxidoreductase C-terminal domain-containing protein, partial [Anaerolineae bacterium]|nr:aldehyde ferredoxin oxidoreductase C-terminal domain-containing protein [Anaerolineae bacterium]